MRVFQWRLLINQPPHTVLRGIQQVEFCACVVTACVCGVNACLLVYVPGVWGAGWVCFFFCVCSSVCAYDYLLDFACRLEFLFVCRPVRLAPHGPKHSTFKRANSNLLPPNAVFDG